MSTLSLAVTFPVPAPSTIPDLANTGALLRPVGPMGSFASLHDSSKLVLIGAMWMGRLELMTVLVLLRPEVWGRAAPGTTRIVP